MKNKINSTVLVPVFCVLVAIVTIFVGAKISRLKNTQDVSTKTPLGEMVVRVVDGMTDKPIEGATIVVPELNKSFQSDGNGVVKITQIPITQNEHFEKILRQKWGEITLLVYKESFLPYALFYAQVWEFQARQGPTIYLFKASQSQEKQPLGVIEGPEKDWINNLVEKYKPKK